MTNSDGLRQRAADIVRSLRKELDEQWCAQHIDGPVDRALASFVFDWRTPPSIERFHSVISALVTHVYANGLATRHVLSRTQATAEAIGLLEVAYQGTHEAGYDGAVLDALTETGSGIDIVLARLAEIVKLRQRHRYWQWTFARHLDPLDWPLRCAVVDVLLEQHRADGDVTLASGPPARFADHISDLLDSDRGTEGHVDPNCRGRPPFPLKQTPLPHRSECGRRPCFTPVVWLCRPAGGGPRDSG